MGLIGKLVGKAAKNVAISATAALYEKQENAKTTHTNPSRKEKSYPNLSGYTIFTIDRHVQPSLGRAVRDEHGTILYHIKEKSSGKRFQIYDKNGIELFCISTARGNRAIIRHLSEKQGEVRSKLSLTGFYYVLSWLDWRVETNLLDTERRYLLKDQEIAKTSFFVFGQDSHLIYIKTAQDLENLLIASFSIDAIKSYNSEHSSSNPEYHGKSVSHIERKEKRDKTTRKKSSWTSWADLSDASWDYEDDDDD